MYCSKCGVQNSDGSTHCVNCGSILMEVPDQSVPVQPQPAVVPMKPKTYGLAVAAFVMGLLSVTCILWPFLVIPAIVCGIIALVKISKSQGQLKGTGLAVTGLVIPAVLALILPIFLAIMLPALGKARDVAKRVVCATNMKGLSTAMMVYMSEYDGKFPTPQQWCDLLIQEVDVSTKCFQCPEEPEGSFSYAINQNIYNVQPGPDDAQMVVLFEANFGRNGVGGPEDLILRHGSCRTLGCNMSFADGHTEFVNEDRIADLKWMVE